MSTPRTIAMTLVAGLGSVTLAACSTVGYSQTVVPTATTGAAATSAAAIPPVTCDNATASYAPAGAPSDAASPTMQTIRRNKVVRVGVSTDSFLLGARSPLDGQQIEGFDIDMAKVIAKAALGDESKVQLVPITAAARLTALTSGAVDIVARNMTMTCDRWNTIAFSAEYYHAGQKVLVRRDATATTLEELTDKKVCAASGTTNLALLQQKYPKVVAVVGSSHTDCLVKFQQGLVEAITADDTVLAGFVAQDPYASVPAAAPISAEPYGIGMRKDDVAFVRFVNQALAQAIADGRWKSSYDKWLGPALGPATAPAPNYGRG